MIVKDSIDRRLALLEPWMIVQNSWTANMMVINVNFHVERVGFVVYE